LLAYYLYETKKKLKVTSLNVEALAFGLHLDVNPVPNDLVLVLCWALNSLVVTGNRG
jgi:hypothetical protein